MKIRRGTNSTKLAGKNKVTPPLVTPLMDNGASIEEALTRIVDSMGEQKEQMSTRNSELERAVHVERVSLRKEINRIRQEVSRSEKHLEERADKCLAKNLSRTGSNRPMNPMNIRGGSIGSRPVSNEKPTQDEHANRTGDSSSWNHSNQGRQEWCSRDSNNRYEQSIGIFTGYSGDGHSVRTSEQIHGNFSHKVVQEVYKGV